MYALQWVRLIPIVVVLNHHRAQRILKREPRAYFLECNIPAVVAQYDINMINHKYRGIYKQHITMESQKRINPIIMDIHY